VNQWLTLRNRWTGSNLVDLGRGAVRDTAHRQVGRRQLRSRFWPPVGRPRWRPAA